MQILHAQSLTANPLYSIFLQFTSVLRKLPSLFCNSVKKRGIQKRFANKSRHSAISFCSAINFNKQTFAVFSNIVSCVLEFDNGKSEKTVQASFQQEYHLVITARFGSSTGFVQKNTPGKIEPL